MEYFEIKQENIQLKKSLDTLQEKYNSLLFKHGLLKGRWMKSQFEQMSGLLPAKNLEGLKHDKVIEAACTVFELPKSKVLSNRRDGELVLVRDVICYVLYSNLKMSKSSIGRLLKRDHTTVIHAVAKMNDKIPLSEELQKKIQEVIELAPEVECVNPLKIAV